MNLPTISLPHFLSRARRTAAPRPEKVKGIYLQEQNFGLASDDLQVDTAAGKILPETTRTARRASAAGTTAFVP